MNVIKKAILRGVEFIMESPSRGLESDITALPPQGVTMGGDFGKPSVRQDELSHDHLFDSDGSRLFNDRPSHPSGTDNGQGFDSLAGLAQHGGRVDARMLGSQVWLASQSNQDADYSPELGDSIMNLDTDYPSGIWPELGEFDK